jgi:glutamate synthase (NADPH/NADH) small chain
MGKATGFLEINRQTSRYQPVEERIKHFNEFTVALTEEEVRDQGARCMECGVPFCHTGCPLQNIIPEWNDLVYRKKWREAIDILHSTNNFPEFTGKVCPAPCETACTLYLQDNPVSIKEIECAIIDRAWEEGWIKPQIPKTRTGKKVAVVGSGPAGLACAQQLARAGHHVCLFEKEDRIGGLLRYGIPDFKMSKKAIDRRLAQMRSEGVEFHTQVEVGVDLSSEQLLSEYDAVVLAMGSEQPRDLPVPGRELTGIYFAMDFLRQQNRINAGTEIPQNERICAKDKHVIVIGGGDTGSDCIGTSIRQGAKSVTQLEIMPEAPEYVPPQETWPNWPNRLRLSSSQQEGCERLYSVATHSFSGESGKVSLLNGTKVAWIKDDKGNLSMQSVDGGEFSLKADLVLLAMGFVHPVHAGLIESLGLQLDARGNVAADMEDYQTSVSKVFAAGDARRGQSLVVWAIKEGRQAAYEVDRFLMGHTSLAR